MKLRAYEVRRIVDAVDEQLMYEPEIETRHKKIIHPDEQLPFQHLDPVWQLSLDPFRVFYDVAKPEDTGTRQAVLGVVSIRAVRRKPAHKTTTEIL